MNTEYTNQSSQTEPVNQQLLALVKSFGHKAGCSKNAFGEHCTCGVDEAIAAAEQQTDKQLERLFSGKAHEIRASLAVMKARGMEVIPSAGCDHKDAKGYCLGHEENKHQGQPRAGLTHGADHGDH